MAGSSPSYYLDHSVEWRISQERGGLERRTPVQLELVYCGTPGKYGNNEGRHEVLLGASTAWAPAPQYASAYMGVTVWRDGT